MSLPDLQTQNELYAKLSPEKRIERIYRDYEKVLLTSSFGSTSVLLIHLFNQVNPDQELHFINTGFHFTETLDFKEELRDRYGLKIVEVRPEKWISKFTTSDRTWEKDADWCCSLNKVTPFEPVKEEYKVWASGLMRHQNANRSGLQVFEEKKGMLRFYPILDLTQEQVNQYFKEYDLPSHPLQRLGYNSIGCLHCTMPGEGRSGRWVNAEKSECGLHV